MPITCMCIYKDTLYSQITFVPPNVPQLLHSDFQHHYRHGQLIRAGNCLSIIRRVGHTFINVDLVCNCSVLAYRQAGVYATFAALGQSCQVIHLTRILIDF